MNAHGGTPQEPSVNDIADATLLERAMKDCRRLRGRDRSPLWAIVARRFALGSGYSAQLCRRFGLDPDEQVKCPAGYVR